MTNVVTRPKSKLVTVLQDFINQTKTSKLKRVELLFTLLCLTCSVTSIAMLSKNYKVLGISSVSSAGLAIVISRLSKKYLETEVNQLRDFYLDQIAEAEQQSNQFIVKETERIKTNAATILQQTIETWESKNGELYKQLTSLTNNYKNLESVKDGLVSQLRLVETELKQAKTEKQELLDTLKGNELALQLERQRLEIHWGQFASEKAMAESSVSFAKEQLELERKALEATAKDLESETVKQIAAYQQRISQLETILQPYLVPKKSSGKNQAECIADQIIDILWTRELPVDFDSAWEEKDVIEVRIQPKGDTTLKAIREASEVIERAFHLSQPPEIRNNLGCVQITLNYVKAKPDKPIVEPEKNWLENTLIQIKDGIPRPNHGRIVGESESGKSALVNNCLGILNSKVTGLSVKLADPLFKSGESNWDFEPTYKDADECLEGLIKAAELVQARIDNPNLSQSYLLFILDEVDDMVAQFGDRVTEAIKKIWKQGRHVGVWLWILGQSPYAKTIKMGIYDLKNAVNFFVGTTIPKGLGEFSPTDDKRDYWLRQYQFRLDEGQSYLVCVCPKRNQPFIAELPKPNQYADSNLFKVLVSQTSYQTASEQVINQSQTALDTKTGNQSFEGLNQFEPGSEHHIRVLLSTGLKPFEVVYQIWKIKPSRSKEYKSKLRMVEACL